MWKSILLKYLKRCTFVAGYADVTGISNSLRHVPGVANVTATRLSRCPCTFILAQGGLMLLHLNTAACLGKVTFLLKENVT